MGIFIVCIAIMGPLFCVDYINIKISLIIIIINFNGILKMACLAMLVIFHVNVISCRNFNLPHIYCIFAKKNSFFEMKIFKLITRYSNMVQN